MDAKTKDKLKHMDVDSSKITDEQTRSDVGFLLNGVEQLATENQQLEEQNQKLKDEINRLNGEQGKPDIRPQKKDDGDVSSERERKPKEPLNRKKRKKKKDTIKASRVKKCRVDQTSLPSDAIFKDYDSVVIQDIVIKPDNIEFKREVYYSPSLKKRFIAPMPPGYQGEYGPGIKSFILCLYNDSNITEPALYRLLNSVGIVISKATISRIITDDVSIFHEEKQSIVAAGLQSTGYQHIDDTGARVNGKNHYTHVLCNPFYTAYFTRPSKDRLTVLKIIAGDDLEFHLNEESLLLMRELGLPEKYLSRIEERCNPSRILNEFEIDELLREYFPDPSKHHKNRKVIKEASAVVAYQCREDAIKILLCDDAPQFKSITEYLSLCWVHEGRHYKKLKPFRAVNQVKLDNFIDEFWGFYRVLLDYKKSPGEQQAEKISNDFDALFGKCTGYDLLDERIAKTRAKKDNLLLVLKHPHLPLHNNPAELGARTQARKRDISLQTKNDKGTEAKDSMMTIVGTATKLGVNVFDYIHDRISKAFSMPSLASVITKMSQATPDTG